MNNLNLPIETLELAVRSANACKNLCIKTIGELVQKSEDDIARTRCVGKRSLQEIKEKLNEIGLHLGMTEQEISKAESKKYSEPAFPCKFPDGFESYKGMDLRDYFAGQALNQATKAAWSEYGQGEFDDYEKIFTRAAEIAYKTADAMLAERDKE